MEAPARWRLFLWRLPGGVGRRPWRACVAALALVVVVGAWVRLGGFSLTAQTVHATCMTYEATVPRSWQVSLVPPVQDCDFAAGRVVFVVPSSIGTPVVILVQDEGIRGVNQFSETFGSSSISRSGVHYTEIVESDRNLTDVVVTNRHAYTVRCQQGGDAACRDAVSALLDGSTFGD